jgi:hypothetical protein
MRVRSTLCGGALLAVAGSAFVTVAGLEAQLPQPWLNSPVADGEQPVFPFFEGWYDNGDGTYTLSFGYLNRNNDRVLEIPHGERNYVEPAQFDGAQPTNFLPSRMRGAFAITITEAQRGQDVWWHLIAEDGSDYKVPGRTSASAYQLDWYPRPHGSLAPLAWFTSERDAARGPAGLYAPQTMTARVGQPVTLSVSGRDPSERDPNDRRFREPVALRVVWSKYQGPEGTVTFAVDPSTPAPPPPPAGAAAGGRGGRGAAAAGPEEVRLTTGAGTARVQATFPAPGDYVIKATLDNWDSPDSSAGDQCCWTNAYIRVRVNP